MIKLTNLSHKAMLNCPVRNSSYQGLMHNMARSMMELTYQKDKETMRALPTFLQRLLGPGEEDHLTGAIDLSDAAYCFDLLTRNLAEDCAQFFPHGIGPSAELNSTGQVT